MKADVSEFQSRESILAANSELIRKLQSRLKANRFRPAEGDSIRIQYMRTLISSFELQNKVLKDVELDEIKKRLEALEGSQNQPGNTVYTHVFEGIQ